MSNNGNMGSFISAPSEHINYLLLTFPFSNFSMQKDQSSEQFPSNIPV